MYWKKATDEYRKECKTSIIHILKNTLHVFLLLPTTSQHFIAKRIFIWWPLEKWPPKGSKAFRLCRSDWMRSAYCCFRWEDKAACWQTDKDVTSSCRANGSTGACWSWVSALDLSSAARVMQTPFGYFCTYWFRERQDTKLEMRLVSYSFFFLSICFIRVDLW